MESHAKLIWQFYSLSQHNVEYAETSLRCAAEAIQNLNVHLSLIFNP